MNKEEKSKKLKESLAKIEKTYGNGSVVKLGETNKADVEFISTGSLKIDTALNGGIPKGRITEILGLESTFKSSICMQTVAECQKQGGQVCYLDYEHAFSREQAENLGVNVNELYFVQPTTAEEGLDILEELVRSESFSLIIVDSVGAMLPSVENDDDMAAQKMGVLARIMSKACRKITGIASKTNTALVFVNQYRQVIGSYVPTNIGSGGLALKFFASLRIETSKSNIKDGDQIVGNTLKVKVLKSKVGTPFKIATVNYYFDRGFDKVGEVMDLAIELGFIAKGGAWYQLENGTKLQGEEKVKVFLSDNPEYLADLESRILTKIKDK